MVDGKRIMEKELEKEIFIVDDMRVVVNVNTLEDIRIAELMLQQRFGEN